MHAQPRLYLRRNGPLVCRLLVLIFCLCSDTPAVAFVGDGGSEPRGSAFDRLKQFLQDTPPVEELRFTYYPRPEQATDGTTIKEKAPRYVAGGWSPRSLWVIHGLDKEILSAGASGKLFSPSFGSLVLKNEDDLWLFTSDPNRAINWSGTPTAPVDQRNPVLLRYNISARYLFSALALGPNSLPPRSIRWESNSFTYVGKVFSGDTWTVRGTIFPDAFERAARMEVSYRGPGVEGAYNLRYEYTGDRLKVPDFIPNRITSALVIAGHEFKDNQFEIDSLIVTTNEQKVAVDPRLVLSRDDYHQFLYTGGMMHERRADGQLVLARMAPLSPLNSLSLKERMRQNRYYYLAAAILSAAHLVLFRNFRTCENNIKQRGKS